MESSRRYDAGPGECRRAWRTRAHLANRGVVADTLALISVRAPTPHGGDAHRCLTGIQLSVAPPVPSEGRSGERRPRRDRLGEASGAPQVVRSPDSGLYLGPAT